MPSLEQVARRAADRAARERASGDDWKIERIIEAECASAGLIGDEARQMVRSLVAILVDPGTL